MKQRNITVTIIPDKRRIKNDVTYSLKLRVTYKGTRKYYATGYNASLNDYSLMMQDRVRGELRKTNLALREVQINAQNAATALKVFPFENLKIYSFQKEWQLQIYNQPLMRMSENLKQMNK